MPVIVAKALLLDTNLAGQSLFSDSPFGLWFGGNFLCHFAFQLLSTQDAALQLDNLNMSAVMLQSKNGTVQSEKICHQVLAFKEGTRIINSRKAIIVRKVDEIALVNLKVLHVIFQLAHVIWREVTTHGLEFNHCEFIVLGLLPRDLLDAYQRLFLYPRVGFLSRVQPRVQPLSKSISRQR